MQTRTGSLTEQLLNVGSGFVISSLLQQFVITPLFDLDTSIAQNLGITVIFTIVSVARGYFWRRCFNRLTHKNYKRTSNEETDWLGW